MASDGDSDDGNAGDTQPHTQLPEVRMRNDTGVCVDRDDVARPVGDIGAVVP